MKTLRTEAIEISTVTPMRNELPCVREFVRRVDSVLRATSNEYEIIVVNDGSTDGTGDLLNELTAEFPRLRPVHLNRSFGQALATDSGFQHSIGHFVVMLDGDLEQPPEEIPKLIAEARKGFDLVSGQRTKRTINRFLRAIPSRAANWLLRKATGCEVRDMGGIKCVRGEIARSLQLRPGHHRFLPALIHVLGGSVTEIPVATSPRFAGQSHYGISRTVDVLMDVFQFWMLTSGKGRPVYLFGRLGLMLLAAASLSLLTCVGSFFSGNALSTWPLLILSGAFAVAAATTATIGVGLELLSEIHGATIDRRSLRVAEPPTDIAAPTIQIDSRRHVA